jgi:hypothetical protein
MKPILAVFLFLPLMTTAGPVKKKPVIQPNEVSGTIQFSNTPFTGISTASKTDFTSGDYIYARLEVSGSSIKEAFKIREISGRYFLVCELEVLKDGQPVGYHRYQNNYLLLPTENLDKNWVNLDILPEPAKASTLYSMTEDFSAGYGYTPMYHMITPDYFPEGGNYRVNVKLFARTVDAYDREQDSDKWPFIEDGFDFTLRESDIATLKKNGKTAQGFVTENAFRIDKMPAVFANPGKLTDPNATTAKVAAILKRDLPERAIIKFVAEQYSGVLWHIAKDDYGLPTYRYFNPHIWMAYKSNGKCYVGFVTLRQTYSGGGTYGPLQVAWTSTKEDRGIDCAKVK